MWSGEGFSGCWSGRIGTSVHVAGNLYNKTTEEMVKQWRKGMRRLCVYYLSPRGTTRAQWSGVHGKIVVKTIQSLVFSSDLSGMTRCHTTMFSTSWEIHVLPGKVFILYISVVLIMKCMVPFTDEKIFQKLTQGYDDEGAHTQAEALNYLGEIFKPNIAELRQNTLRTIRSRSSSIWKTRKTSSMWFKSYSNVLKIRIRTKTSTE